MKLSAGCDSHCAGVEPSGEPPNRAGLGMVLEMTLTTVPHTQTGVAMPAHIAIDLAV